MGLSGDWTSQGRETLPMKVTTEKRMSVIEPTRPMVERESGEDFTDSGAS